MSTPLRVNPTREDPVQLCVLLRANPPIQVKSHAIVHTSEGKFYQERSGTTVHTSEGKSNLVRSHAIVHTSEGKLYQERSGTTVHTSRGKPNQVRSDTNEKMSTKVGTDPPPPARSCLPSTTVHISGIKPTQLRLDRNLEEGKTGQGSIEFQLLRPTPLMTSSLRLDTHNNSSNSSSSNNNNNNKKRFKKRWFE